MHIRLSLIQALLAVLGALAILAGTVAIAIGIGIDSPGSLQMHVSGWALVNAGFLLALCAGVLSRVSEMECRTGQRVGELFEGMQQLAEVLAQVDARVGGLIEGSADLKGATDAARRVVRDEFTQRRVGE